MPWPLVVGAALWLDDVLCPLVLFDELDVLRVAPELDDVPGSLRGFDVFGIEPCRDELPAPLVALGELVVAPALDESGALCPFPMFAPSVVLGAVSARSAAVLRFTVTRG